MIVTLVAVSATSKTGVAREDRRTLPRPEAEPLEMDPDMRLVGRLDSPYVRRVAISLRMMKLPFEHEALSVFRDFEAFAAINPLVQAPTLRLEDGTVLMDSTLILEYLERICSPDLRLTPSPPDDFRVSQRLIGLALAACEKSVQIVYETNLRPPRSGTTVARTASSVSSRRRTTRLKPNCAAPTAGSRGNTSCRPTSPPPSPGALPGAYCRKWWLRTDTRRFTPCRDAPRRRRHSWTVRPTERGVSICWRCVRTANAAIAICLPPVRKREYARSSARFARRARRSFSRKYARIVRGTWLRDRSGPPVCFFSTPHRPDASGEQQTVHRYLASAKAKTVCAFAAFPDGPKIMQMTRSDAKTRRFRVITPVLLSSHCRPRA